MDNLKHMQSALALAKKGCGFVNPNPMVGAVIVKDGRVIGQGWHEYFGGPHAERNALRNCTDSPEMCIRDRAVPVADPIILHMIKIIQIGSISPNHFSLCNFDISLRIKEWFLN